MLKSCEQRIHLKHLGCIVIVCLSASPYTKPHTHTCQPPEYKNLETTPKIFKVGAIFISGPFFWGCVCISPGTEENWIN